MCLKRASRYRENFTVHISGWMVVHDLGVIMRLGRVMKRDRNERGGRTIGSTALRCLLKCSSVVVDDSS